MQGRRRIAVLIVLALALVAVAVGGIATWRRAHQSTTSGAASAARPKHATAPRRAPWQPIHLSSGSVEASDAGALGSFSGRVISSSDLSPVAGAEITFVDNQSAHAVTTDKSGAFEFLPPREGTYQVQSITAQGFLPFSAELGASPLSLAARPGQRVRDITLFIVPQLTYIGKVVDPDNAAVAGAEVRILDLFGEPLALPGTPATHVSDAKGEFRFHAPDGAVLEARHAKYASGRARLDFSAQVSHRLVIRLRAKGAAEPAHAISGRVVDDTKNPVGGVTVTAIPERGASESPLVGARATADAEGRFELRPLSPGRYSLFASEPGSAPAVRRHVEAPARDVELVLGPAATLSGRVTDAETGAPVTAFSVVVSARAGPLAIETVKVASVFDADGRYRIDDLAPGRYLVSASARSYARAPDRELELTESGASADFALARGAKLVGVVRDADSHQPIARAKISLEGRSARARDAEEEGVSIVSVAVSNEQGAFELDGLPAGEHSALVAAAKHHGRIHGPFTVRGSETIGPVEIELTPTKEGEEPRIELFGIGAVLTADGEVLRIGRVLEGGGAAEKGLRPGDAILAVEGVAVTQLGFDLAIQRIRGPEGSYVTLSVRRESDKTENLAVPRRRIRS